MSGGKNAPFSIRNLTASLFLSLAALWRGVPGTSERKDDFSKNLILNLPIYNCAKSDTRISNLGWNFRLDEDTEEQHEGKQNL